jgi:hydroxypyruvate reductase
VEVIVSNRLALEAVSRRASELGLLPRILDGALAGEAAPTGRRLAQRLLSYAEGPATKRGGLHKDTFCLIWGGETTVTLGPAPGVGGRNQELALAAAQVIAGSEPAALMSVGTDGRDGPSEAAGAIVEQDTWSAIRRAGRDPARDLAGHNAFPALVSAGAIIPAHPTGTNVMDVVIGLRPA